MVKEYNYVNILESNIELRNQKVIIYGLSKSALDVYVKLVALGADIVGFTDYFASTGGLFCDLPVYDVEEVKNMNNIYVYVSTSNTEYLREILDILEETKNQVLCKGTVYGAGLYDVFKLQKMIQGDEDKINEVASLFADKKSIKIFNNLIKYRMSNQTELLKEIYEKSHKQYFPIEEIFTPTNDEIFIDAGGYNGQTSVEFAEWVDNKYEKIYIMEPDYTMQRVTKEYIKLKRLNAVTVIGKGAYSHSATLRFNNSIESGSSCINERGNAKIETIGIDEMLNGERASYIKMDIEGAEMEALKGAHNTINRFRPKLAISVYHKEDDLWNIPDYLHKKYPWYKFYLRHYTPITTETILYATEK